MLRASGFSAQPHHGGPTLYASGYSVRNVIERSKDRTLCASEIGAERHRSTNPMLGATGVRTRRASLLEQGLLASCIGNR